LSFPRPDGLRAVSFDLGGTLIRAWPDVGTIYAGVCGAHGLNVSAEACHRGFESAWARRAELAIPGRDRFSSWPGGEDGWWGGVVADVLASCGVDPGLAPGVEAFRAAFASDHAWKVYDDVHDSLDGLRAAGYRLAILSNWDSRMTGLLDPRRLMWANDFPHSDSTWPHSQELLAKHASHLTEEERDLMLAHAERVRRHAGQFP